jgi:hypothetical protein
MTSSSVNFCLKTRTGPHTIPCELKPVQTYKFFTSGHSPSISFPSGVNDSGPAKYDCIPLSAFVVATGCTAPTGKKVDLTRGILLVTHMAALQAKQRRESHQPSSRVQHCVPTQALCQQRDPMHGRHPTRLQMVAKGSWLLEREEHRANNGIRCMADIR